MTLTSSNRCTCHPRTPCNSSSPIGVISAAEHALTSTILVLGAYQDHVREYLNEIQNVILMGGEPTLHADIGGMVAFNQRCGKKTTIYTNGVNLRALEDLDLTDVEIRIGVYGSTTTEKALSRVQRTELPVTIVFMLRNDNIDELPRVAAMAEDFRCENFYISSIRDIAQTHDYWKDNEETVPLPVYYRIIQDFVDCYTGRMNLHIARLGIITINNDRITEPVTSCRFGNIFIDGRKIICPFDIAKELYTDQLVYGQRKCTKNDSCIVT